MMKLLLLVVMLALHKCHEAESGERITLPTSEITYEDFSQAIQEYGDYYIFREEYYSMENIPVPNITVYRQMEDREHDSVIVLCIFDQMRYSRQILSFELSVESELNYTKENLKCTSSDREMCVFLVTVSPPASFTCVHEIYSYGEVKNLSSHTYSYKRSVLGHHKEVSLFYICFSSFLAVGLVIMTVALIVTIIRSKAKDSINHTTAVTDNDYMDA